MKIAFRKASKQRVSQARVLAFLMLVGIVYQVTLGSAHSHTDLSSQLNTSGFTGSVQQIGSFSHLPLQRSTDERDCLICRFHQQLSNSAIDARIFVAAPTIREPVTPGENYLDYSNSFAFTPIARHSGRAPPLA